MTIDPATDTVYVVTEQANTDGTSELNIFGLTHQELLRSKTEQSPRAILTWTSESASPLPELPLVISIKYLPESDSLILILSNGDLEAISDPSQSNGQESIRENVGTFDSGIKAAAWSYDEELLTLVTGDDLLISMTSSFDVLSEGKLTTSSFGVDAPVNVGWGDKTTQFHGSVGKSAAQQPTTSEGSISSSPDDDGKIRISWRGDSAYFSISNLETTPGMSEGKKRRVLRVYNRIGELSSTAEPCSGLESALNWRPSGSIIAGTQRRDQELHVVFFERNGLRRYDFELREMTGKGKVRELSWNAESNLLAIWLRRESSDVVQLWNRNNYCWTLKQEISPRSPLTSIFWHPEQAYSLYLTTSSAIELYSLAWDTFASSRPAPNDSGSVAVVDGSTLKLTPFRLVNIPPPMSARVFDLQAEGKTPAHLSFSKNDNGFAVVYDHGLVQRWNWDLTLETKRNQPRNEIPAPFLAWSRRIEGDGYSRQCAVVNETVAVLRSRSDGATEVALVKKEGEVETLQVERAALRIEAGEDVFVLEARDGTLFEVLASATSEDSLPPSDDLMSFPEFCPYIRPLALSASSIVLGLSSSGRLYGGPRLLASDANSFTCTSDFLIYTTFTHEAKFIPLISLETGNQEGFVAHVENVRKPTNESSGEGSNGAIGIRRAVERGSRIVTVVESSTTLILQMPRGNLETICPRPLVLRIVRQELDRGRYRTAFLTCRRHRIDLNILHDHDPTTFQARLSDFITQIKDVDHLNLFLSGLKDEDVTRTMYRPLILSSSNDGPGFDATGKVNEICDLVRAELDKRDVFEYANTILTTHVRKKPADYEAALRVLVELKKKDAERAEDAIRYIIFLSDANKLYDLALGMYDFPLVLLIAQESQKDPREYLPFLRELRQLEMYEQRYRIDDHLERHDSALRNLAKAEGADAFERALTYTKKHGLFETALEAYKDDSPKYKTVMAANADYLIGRGKYMEAALLFNLASQPTKAMEAYAKANAWQELFTLALSSPTEAGTKRPASEIKALAGEVAESLKSKRRFGDAGKVLLEYGRDIDGAVAVLGEGNEFAECLRIISLYSRRDLIETHVKPATLETQSRLLEEFNDLQDQLEKQADRLDELKKRKEANPNQYFCIDDPSLGPEDIEVQPDGESDAGTAFTRYTAAAPTTVGGASRISSSRTSRSRRRAAVKKAAGKKGSIYEETYLLNSIKKSLEVKLAEMQTETGTLLPTLLLLHSPTHRAAAATLQSELTSLEECIKSVTDRIWAWREKEWATERAEEMKLRERGEWVEKPKPEEGTEKVDRPKVAKEKWRLGLLDAL